MKATVSERDRIDSIVDEMLRNPIEPSYSPYPIQISGKVIQQISTGIYRSPGNVVKELVSNSFDADAPEVIVRTGSPSFEKFSLLDKGMGMSPQEFIVRMASIGSSGKATKDKTPGGRPVIGKVGIGLLSGAHVSRKFTVISGKRGQEQGFEAKVDMARFFEPEAESKPIEEMTKGSLMIRTYKKPEEEHFTLIDFAETSETWKEQLGQGWADSYFAQGQVTFREFVTQMQDDGIREGRMAGYDQLLWELGLLCPVKYLEEGPVIGIKDKIVSQLKERMDSFKFELTVDGIEIRKPFLFPAKGDDLKPGSDYGVYPISISDSTNRGLVKAIGYIYHQAVRINPPELRGIQPRIRNVGIGMPSYNMFRLLTEAPVISYQVFGELYVDEGLDDALNIDRSSFFEADPAFRILVKRIEDELRSGDIIGDIRERQNNRSQARKKDTTDYIEQLLSEIAEAGGLPAPKFKFYSSFAERPIQIDDKTREVTFYNRAIPRKNRDLIFGMLLCYELSRKAKNPDSKFYELVKTFLEDRNA
jgi:hypothetical protein